VRKGYTAQYIVTPLSFVKVLFSSFVELLALFFVTFILVRLWPSTV